MQESDNPNKRSFGCPAKRMAAMLLVLVSVTFGTLAQKVYSVDREYRADVKVYVTDREYEADLVVYRTDREYRADKKENKGIWFFTKREYQADKKVFFVDRLYRADLIVFFTDREYRAGWKKTEKKHLMY